MNALSLVGGPFADDLFPFSLTRSVADIRCGILTIREKWEIYAKNNPLVSQFSLPANIIPRQELVDSLLANHSHSLNDWPRKLRLCLDIIRFNGEEITHDFELLTRDRRSEPLSQTNKLMGTAIFLEKGALVEHCMLNATEGPIYIGRDALVMEGSMIRGPFALGEKGVVKMGAKIYGASSTGPNCILGGEIKNSVLFGYSNKAHDGYLGDSIIGEWCNLGAGSSNSNIKNSGGEVKYWNPVKKAFVQAGQKCGLLMGDYSRSAINTSFNTGTVTGICCHVFGIGATPAYLPSFSWGFNQDRYAFDKAIQHIGKWKKLKGQDLAPEEINQLKIIFDQQNQNK
jgi:UDP-N-acetylglucosamine diphosphorylase / glucose-1-phosphate thymidylyltransferase / UDP-N-acetylgalactosamine diphosphorylase / glucosamine-1-phosphate N-acetyltransferase / galactosamine-1-phosphate N-acetyltransferase